jgi:translation initiation factor IF-2
MVKEIAFLDMPSHKLPLAMRTRGAAQTLLYLFAADTA